MDYVWLVLGFLFLAFIPASLKAKRRYWFCNFCGGTKNWLDKKGDGACRKCGTPIGTAKVKPLSESEKELIRKRDEWICVNCGRKIYKHKKQNVHHLRARHFGGTNDPGNLALLCEKCHKDVTPGWQEALDAYRAGNKNAFKEWAEEKAYQTHQYDEEMRSRMLIAYGVVKERERLRNKK